LSLSSIAEATKLRDSILERMSAADVAYYVLDEPIMEDGDYDALKIALREIEDEFPNW
jgi:DNA ligase (NAD+)